MTYLHEVISQPTPQSEPLDDRQVPNHAGGYVYPVDDHTRLLRFLILGSEGGSYYASQRELTLENARAVQRCVQQDGARTIEIIREVRRNNRAPTRGPSLLALAIGAAHGDTETRQAALAALPEVARTAQELLQFVQFTISMRGWGRALRRTVGAWYASKPLRDMAYQVVKYRNRHSWNHRDLLRTCHPSTDSPGLAALFDWLAHDKLPDPQHPELRLLHAFQEARTATMPELLELIRQDRLTWEMMPEHMLAHPEVWQALAEDMPLTALVQNLGNLTAKGAIGPMEHRWATERLQQIGDARENPIHPANVLQALMVYRSGCSQRGDNTWNPVGQVSQAMDLAFERSFQNSPETGARYYLGVDVSGSMSAHLVAGIPGLTARMAASAMAMVVARREPNHCIRAFSSKEDANAFRGNSNIMMPLDITAQDSLTDAMQKTQGLPFGRTDCALPMLDAMENDIPVDCFVILTDNETWKGSVHPAEALRQYRRKTGIPAKLAVVAMVSNGISIADPQDAGMLDMAGFDTAAPAILADFATHRPEGPPAPVPGDQRQQQPTGPTGPLAVTKA